MTWVESYTSFYLGPYLSLAPQMLRLLTLMFKLPSGVGCIQLAPQMFSRDPHVYFNVVGMG